MQNGTKIGDLAARCGVSPDTIRFYEREGLLPPPRRTASGHRIYGRDAFVRLQFIRRAQGIGLTLQDIGEILLLRDRKDPKAGQWITRRLRARAEAIDREMAKLRVYRRLLEEGIRLSEASASGKLPRLERLLSIGKR
jgi:MerR family transcriptional regulator, copper efflux regulator